MKKLLLLGAIALTPLIAEASGTLPATNITSQCSCTSSYGQIKSCQAVPAARMVAFDVKNSEGNFVNGPIAAPVGYSETKNTVDAPIINPYGQDAIVTAPPGFSSYTYAAVFPIAGLENATSISVVLVYDESWKIETLTPFNSTWIDPKTCHYTGPSIVFAQQLTTK